MGDVGDVTVTNLTTGDSVTPTGWTYDADTNTVTFAMPPLTDGNYHAVLSAAGVSDPAGNHPAADATVDFFVLAADANHDRTVDLTDFTVLAANFNGTAKTWPQGDFNYDGHVDLTDFTILATNFNGTGKNFGQGDFNYDTKVDLTDFTILASSFNKTLPAAAPLAPTPLLAAPTPASSGPFLFSRVPLIDDILA